MIASQSVCRCPPVSPCTCRLRTLSNVVSISEQTPLPAPLPLPPAPDKRHYNSRLTNDERRRIIDAFLSGQTLKQIRSSFGNKIINLRTIQSVIRTFQMQGRIESKQKLSGRKRKYTGTNTKNFLARFARTIESFNSSPHLISSHLIM
jgi:hypothetical protein